MNTFYVSCCRPDVAGDVISGENVKTVKGHAVLNFEVASFSNLPRYSRKSFSDGGGGDGGRHRR